MAVNVERSSDAPWPTMTIGDLFSVTAGRSKSASLSPGGRYVVMDMGSVARDGSVVASKRTDVADDLLRRGDLVMPKDDIGGGNIIGLTAYIDRDDSYVLGDHVYRLRALGEEIEPLFFHYLINSEEVRWQVRRSVVGSAQLGLGKTHVLGVSVSVPSLAEQRVIAAALADADEMIESLREARQKAVHIREGMMQALLSGDVRLLIGHQGPGE